MKKTVLLLFLLMTLFFSMCKKYPDGPLINLEPKRWRMMDDWTIYYYSVDGNDSTSLFNAPNNGIINMNKYEQRDQFFYEHKIASGYFSFEGYWSFSSDKKRLLVDVSGPDNTETLMPPYITDSTYAGYAVNRHATDRVVQWDIRRLKEHDMWLQTVYKGRTFFMKLKN